MNYLRLLVLCLFSTLAFGQFEVQVVSEENHTPIPGATVRVLSPKGVKNFKTDGRGLFPFTLEEGTNYLDYSLEIIAEGYEPFEFKFDGIGRATCPLKPISEKIDNVVVTGQISLTTQDKSIHKIRVIDRKMIDAKGAVNLRDVLTNELSIRITQDQMLGSGMQMQGFGGDNVKILIDGVPVIGRLNGDVDLSQINLNNIERIEIVEGPLSVNYGSNALAGTINLITKKTVKKGVQANLNTYYETVGNYNVDAKLGYNINRHRFALTGMRNFFDGWKNTDPFMEFPKSKPADTNRVLQWRPKEQYSTDFNYTYVGKKFSINPFANFYWETMTNRGMPRQPSYTSAFDDIFNTKRFNQGVNFNVFPSSKYKVQGVVAHNYYNRIKNTYIKDLTTLDMNLTPIASDQDTTMFRTIMSRSSFTSSSLMQKIDYEVGYDVNFDMAEGKRISDSSKTMGDYAVYGSMEWKAFKGFIAKPAARVAYNSVFAMNIVPSFNVKYGVKDWSFRASYAKGYRAPSMKELYMLFVDVNHDIQGNENLTPEQSHNIQGWINYKLNFKNSKANDELNFELNSYYQTVNNKITLAQNPTGTSYTYFNLDNYESLGGKFIASFRNNWITAKAGMALVGVRTSYATENFFWSPELNSSVMFTWKDAGMNFSVFYKYSGKVVTFLQTDTELQQTFISDYNMLDANISKDFWNKRILVAIGAKNLLNVTNVLSSGASGGVHSSGGSSSPIAWGRSAYIRLSFNFDTFNKKK